MDRDTPRQLGIKPPNRPLKGPHGEDHRAQCQTITKRAGFDRQTDDLKHHLEQGERILEHKAVHTDSNCQLENLILAQPVNVRLGEQTLIPPQMRIKTEFQSISTSEGSFHFYVSWTGSHCHRKPTIELILDWRHILPLSHAAVLEKLQCHPQVSLTAEECPTAHQIILLGWQEPPPATNLSQDQALRRHLGDQKHLPHPDRQAPHHLEARFSNCSAKMRPVSNRPTMP